MEVVIYTRYSSTKQNETSTEAQIKEAYNFCDKNNFTVIRVYSDEAITGKTDNRPQFQKMIADSSKGAFQGVVVYQLDRFARNRYDSATYKAKLKKNGVKVYSAKENIADDASGIIMESVLEGMAEYYSAELSQKVKRNLELNAEKGWFNGGYAPFGYKVEEVKFKNYTKKKLVIDPKTAPVVKEIYEMRVSGVKLLEIVEYLNNKGFKTVQGKKFQKTSLQRILTNKRYIGTSIYNDKEFPNTIPAIIDEELFNRVQEIVNKNKYAPAMSKAKEEYILTTKIFCGHCKEAMTGTCGTSQTGTIYNYYTCNGVKKKKCKRKNIAKSVIEDFVVNECRKILTTKNINIIAKKVYDICQQENSQSCLLKSLEKQIKTLNKNIDNLLKAIESGQNADIINDRITENRCELEKVMKQYDDENSKLINLSPKQIKYFLMQLKNGNINDLKYRKTLVNVFINKIYVYDKNVTILFNVGRTPVTVDKTLIKDLEHNFKQGKNSLFFNTLGQPNLYRYSYKGCSDFLCSSIS